MHRERRCGIVFKVGLAEGWRWRQFKPSSCVNWTKETCPQRMRQSSGPRASPGFLLSDLAPKLTFIDLKDPKVFGLSKFE